MKKEKSCGAVVFYTRDNAEKVLLIKHANSGHWAFPKGHVEAGETEVQTAKREIMEETGVAVDIDEGFRTVVTYSPKKEVIKDVIYFIAFAKNYETQRQESEVAEIRWVKIDEVDESVSYKNDKILAQKAIEFYKTKYKGDIKDDNNDN